MVALKLTAVKPYFSPIRIPIIENFLMYCLIARLIKDCTENYHLRVACKKVLQASDLYKDNTIKFFIPSVFSYQTQEKVLGADVIMVEAPRLSLGEVQHPACLFCELVEAITLY